MKRIIALILALTLLLSSLAGCKNFKFSDEVTRGEWIELLSTTLGMEEYMNNAPYFEDVKSDDELFGYVQSGYEWGVLSSIKKKFEKNDRATQEFVAITAAKSIDSAFSDEEAIKFAEENGIVSSSGSKGVTLEECQKIVEATQKIYLQYKHNYEDKVDLADGVKDLSKETGAIKQTAANEYKMQNEVPKVGDVYIAPATNENPAGVAVKVSEVKKNSDGTYTVKTVTPELNEVVDEISVSEIVVPEVDNIILPEGAKIVSGGGVKNQNSSSTPKAVPMVNSFNNNDVVLLGDDNKPKGASFTIEANFTKGTLSFNQGWENLSKNIEFLNPDDPDGKLGQWFEKSTLIPDRTLCGPDAYKNGHIIEDYKNKKINQEELVKRLEENEKVNGGVKTPTMTNKFSGGYEITGSIGVENMYVYPEIKIETLKVWGVDTKIPTGVERVSVEVNADITSKLSIKGKLENELTVCSIPMPVGPSGVVVTVELKLYVEANGELSIKATVNSNTLVEYSKGKFKKTTSKSESLEAELAVSIEAGPKVNVGLSAYGLKIVNADVSFAILIEASAKVKAGTTVTETKEKIVIDRSTKFITGVDGYIPIIKLSFGTDKETFANLLKLTRTFTLVPKEKAVNFDIVPEKEFILWQEITEFPKEEEKEEIEENSSSTTTSSDNSSSSGSTGGVLSISDYFVTLEKGKSYSVSINGVPGGYSKSDYTWSSADTSIAKVDKNGKITGVGSGSTVVTVKSKDGKSSAQIAVYVS